MQNDEIAAFAAAVSSNSGKMPAPAFVLSARRLLKRIAEELGVPVGRYQVDRNDRSAEVSVALRTETLYVVLSPTLRFQNGPRIYFRGRQGKRDEVGLGNEWVLWSELSSDLPGVLARLKQASKRATALAPNSPQPVAAALAA